MIYSHADLEIVLRGFNAAYNGRCQRVLEGLSPEMVLRQRLKDDPALANPTYRPPSPSFIKRALRIVADAKEVSHPDTQLRSATSFGGCRVDEERALILRCGRALVRA